MNGIMSRKLRRKTGFAQSLHNFTKPSSHPGRMVIILERTGVELDGKLFCWPVGAPMPPLE
jgi:hypothetical protein